MEFDYLKGFIQQDVLKQMSVLLVLQDFNFICIDNLKVTIPIDHGWHLMEIVIFQKKKIIHHMEMRFFKKINICIMNQVLLMDQPNLMIIRFLEGLKKEIQEKKIYFLLNL